MVEPFATLPLAGDTAIETRLAGVTVSVVEPDTLPDTALIVAVPAPVVDASPLEPAALLIVATAVLDEDQVTEAVRSCVELSE